MVLEIQKDLFYTGVNDRRKTLFENLWPLPGGVSYNSYLLRDKKTVLFDTVEDGFSGLFFHKLEKALDGAKLDYLVINHMEPDHSGSIGILRKRYPEVKIIGNSRTRDMLKGYYGITEGVDAVSEGDELETGRYRLQFFLTPMVHWPETMMVYEAVTGTLFSGDAFGCFGALDGRVTDGQMDVGRYWDEMVRYYSNIVGKYGNPVQKALGKLAGLEIRTICSTHGPVWQEKENIGRVISVYDRLSRYEGENGVVILYGTMYGHTEGVAEQIACRLAASGVKNCIIHNVSVSDPSYMIRDVFRYKGLIVGSPTYNNQLFPKVEAILSQLQARDLKNRLFGCFGSYTWAGAAVKRLTAFAESAGWEMVAEPVELKQAQFETVVEGVENLSRAMAGKLTV